LSGCRANVGSPAWGVIGIVVDEEKLPPPHAANSDALRHAPSRPPTVARISFTLLAQASITKTFPDPSTRTTNAQRGEVEMRVDLCTFRRRDGTLLKAEGALYYWFCQAS
jgi:hypothetical protein